MNKKEYNTKCRRIRSKVWIFAEVLNWLTVLAIGHLLGILTMEFTIITTVWMAGKYCYCHLIETALGIRRDTRNHR